MKLNLILSFSFVFTFYILEASLCFPVISHSRDLTNFSQLCSLMVNNKFLTSASIPFITNEIFHIFNLKYNLYAYFSSLLIFSELFVLLLLAVFLHVLLLWESNIHFHSPPKSLLVDRN
jgi:hypothetical protein